MIKQREKASVFEAPLDPLVADLVASVADAPRAYADVMDAWRTSCPHLTIWEDAVDLGLVRRRASADGTGDVVAITDRGRAALERQRA